MLDKSDIIECKSYASLCDFIYDYPNLDDIPPTGVVHVPLDHIESFFQRIDGNGHNYVVVSSCSDFGLARQLEHPVWGDMIKWIRMHVGPQIGYMGLGEQPARCDVKKCRLTDEFSVKCHAYTRATFSHIPENVVHWFVVNLMTKHDKCTAIPFGIAEGKRDMLYQSMVDFNVGEVDIRKRSGIYISWQDYTLERYNLRQALIEYTSVVARPPDKAQPYDEYLGMLAQSQYVVSPPGNGADCYRTLEALYMGAVVLCQDTLTNDLLNLPVHRYCKAGDIIDYANQGNWEMRRRLFDGWHTADRIKLSYWKQQLELQKAKLW